jgi:endonuclease G, mitochondrial
MGKNNAVIWSTSIILSGSLSLIAIHIGAKFFKQVPSVHLTMGNPSGASSDRQNIDNYLMLKQGYAVSYSRHRGTPNWVSWQLNSSWLGNVERSEAWRNDGRLPPDTYQVAPTDYQRSGYDRGHMLPLADRTKSAALNAETFLMTNIIPQASDNNKGAWRDLETEARDLAKQGKELYIISGVVGEKEAIASGKVIAPQSTWKVIVVLDRVGSDSGDVGFNTRVIAVNIPNKDGIHSDWKQYITSVDRIEDATGYDLLSEVPFWVQWAIESRVDGTDRTEIGYRKILSFLISCLIAGGGIVFTYKLLRRRSKQPQKQLKPSPNRQQEPTPKGSALAGFDRLEQDAKKSPNAALTLIDENQDRDLDIELEILKTQLPENQDDDSKSKGS